MNNYKIQNNNYVSKNEKKEVLIDLLAKIVYALMSAFSNEKIASTVKKIAVTVAGLVFIGMLGGIENGTVSAVVGFSVCAAIALGGIIFFREK